MSRGFGRTWWGRAWVDALEQRARLDPNRLPRGRTYARRNTVGELTVGAGEVCAAVQGSRSRPYDVRVRVRTYTPDQWEQVIEALAGRLGHTAALLDGELPPEIAAELRAADLDPLPGAGEVQPRCSCPDWADPCKHAAAVCYLVAEALDEDPFLLFLLRGRSRDELLAALRSRRGGPAAGARAVAEMEGWGKDPGVPARVAWGRSPAALPSTPLPPRSPGRPTVLATDPPPGHGVSADGIRALAADVAQRAWALSHGTAGSGLELTAEEDLARLAAARIGTGGDVGIGTGGDVGIADLARRAGVPSRVLLRQALAWRAGGSAGLATVRDSTPADPAQLEVAKALLGPDTTTWRSRVTAGDRQLRLGPDQRWYPFRRATDGGWDPDGPPAPYVPPPPEAWRDRERY